MKSTLLPLLLLTLSSQASPKADTHYPTKEKAHHQEKASSPSHKESHSSGEIHWGYEGAVAAEYWGDLKPEFLTCKTGHTQSPINIEPNSIPKSGLSPLNLDYQSSSIAFLNNGHTFQMQYTPGSKLTLGGVEYSLLQFHFHTPSEEFIEGKPYAMDAHFVHKSAEGKLAVIGLLFQEGAENPNLNALWDKFPDEGDTIRSAKTLNALNFLPQDKSYWSFDGSLTTPPCSEGVQWFVLKNPVSISAAQLKKFRSVFPHNARPVQPLHNRELKSSN